MIKNKTYIIWVVFIMLFSFISCFNFSLAADNTVTVTLPKFEVRLNGNIVDNSYREFPLLVYKDITYVPMTWYDCRLLGLETEWTKKAGLKIFESQVTSSYFPYEKATKNSYNNIAKIHTSYITVNGKIIDNSKEEYPILSYNNVTYLPLTWRFAHDEFGWEYLWDSKKGLTINSDNPQVKTIGLPEYALNNNLAYFEDYIYFTETVENINNVYRVHESNHSSKELVYSYEFETNYGFYNRLVFNVRDNKLWLTYHMGGAVMGGDIYCLVGDDGKATEVYSGYLDFRNTKNGSLIVNQGVPPSGYNLRFIPSASDQNQSIPIGDKAHIYGWHITKDEHSTSYGNDQSTTLIGDDVYVLASDFEYDSPIENGELNRVYKVNLITNETNKIIDSEVRNFKISNNRLYYVKDEDNFLYSSNLDGSNEVKLSDNILVDNSCWYDEIDGNVYYTILKHYGEYSLFKVNENTEDSLMLDETLQNVQVVNNKLICKLLSEEDYGVKVLDKSGKLNLAITDQVSEIFPYNDSVLLVTDKDKSIKLVKIKD